MLPALHSFWSSGEGAPLLGQASVLAERFAGDTLRMVAALRSAFAGQPPEVVARAVEMALARRKAQAYGEWTKLGLFTRRSVEQATDPAIARHHASRFAGCSTVLEICTGAGFDTAALAAVAGRVISIEADEELAALARHNLAVQGIGNAEIITGRAEDVLPALDLASVDGIWADPSRRAGEGRIDSPEDYEPPLSFVISSAGDKRCGIKIAPGITLDNPDGIQREWIGYHGECREQVLWRHAPVIDNTVSLVDSGTVFLPVTEVERSELVLPYDPDTLAGKWLVEPHNAVVRSGVLHSLYAEDCIGLLDELIAYGICNVQPSPSPLYTAFHILEAFAWNEKKLRLRLRELGWGSGTEIKKRGFPQTPDQVRSRLDLPRKGETGVVVLTRVGERHLVLLCKRTG